MKIEDLPESNFTKLFDGRKKLKKRFKKKSKDSKIRPSMSWENRKKTKSQTTNPYATEK